MLSLSLSHTHTHTHTIRLYQLSLSGSILDGIQYPHTVEECKFFLSANIDVSTGRSLLKKVPDDFVLTSLAIPRMSC